MNMLASHATSNQPCPGGGVVLAVVGSGCARVDLTNEANMFIGVSMPWPGNWTGGARWFRCELSAERADILRREAMPMEKGLKGELSGASPLRLGRIDIPKENVPWKPVDCGVRHNGEYVGVYPLVGSFEEIQSQRDDPNHTKCRSLIAAYAGVPDDRNIYYRTGTYLQPPHDNDFDAGDRLVRCYMWLGDEPRVGSIKGVGTKGFPTR